MYRMRGTPPSIDLSTIHLVLLVSLIVFPLFATSCFSVDTVTYQPRWELRLVSVEVEGEEDTAAVSAESAAWLEEGLLRDGKADYILLEGVNTPYGIMVFSE